MIFTVKCIAASGHREKKSPGSSGFTLLEVLIAIAIFAVCVSVVYALYSAMLSVVHSAEDRSTRNSRVQVTLERFSADLSGLYQPEPGLLVAKPPGDFTDEPILAFVSTSHLSFDPEEPPVPLALIRYYLSQDPEDLTYILLRSDSPVTGAGIDEDFVERRRLVLCEGLMEIKLNYLDRQARENEEWDSVARSEDDDEDVNRFPARVTIELVFPGNGDDRGERYATGVWVRPQFVGEKEDSYVR